MQISCAFAPHKNVVAQAQLAEELGYQRVWIFDSPALYGDVWVTLARIAEHTKRVQLGPAVLVPSLRHVVTQASAIATLAQLAPGRLVVAIGTGFTGRMALGQKPLRWTAVQTYVRQLRALLCGQEVQIDGAAVRMLHPLGYAPCFPISVPILIAANGPKGIAVARAVGDGIMAVGAPQPDFSWSALLVLGTILDPGESTSTPRVLAAVGPALTAAFHGIYEAGGCAVDSLPGGAAWRQRLEQLPLGERHLILHEDHLVRVTERDRALLSGEMVQSFTWTGTTAEIRDRIDHAGKSGATELLYAPLGPDVGRELRSFAAAAGL